ncbi:hypothetical protein [Clostridium beijerinckii]|nr:hypothetical protein [Clostridium beijerinckii]NRT69469.1 hypothetical protein [Clostridium beijerinckii]NRT84383.1 hypothetical protein [Clostridium beijerinckii]NRU49057.1 hypothetical protein [Clostridium beijerinckii]NRZ32943.1 hypothetical protein [Clostridium beijerinckii]NSA12155.1 hypothetical protein [Clostridium beijerinckii]
MFNLNRASIVWSESITITIALLVDSPSFIVIDELAGKPESLQV